MEIGRYSDKDVGLVFLGRGTISASFHIDGNVQVEMGVLKMDVSTGVSISRRGMIIFRLMLSEPTEFEVIANIFFLTS